MAREVDSLGVQKQLNALFMQRLDMENKIMGAMQEELKIALQIRAVIEDLSKEDLAERLDAGVQAMKDLADEASHAGDIGVESMKSIKAGSEKTTKSVGMISSALSGVSSILKAVQTTALGLVGSFFNIGKAMLSIPFRLFGNLLNDAASMPVDPSFMEALEAIRKESGSFKEDVSKNILAGYHVISKGLSDTGLSMWQVFNKPADALKYLQEIMSKAGAQAHQFGKELSTSAGAIAGFDKGLGIGAENMRGMMNRATVFGTNMQTQLNSTANYALQMGKSFGMSSKLIGRDIGIMMKDVKNFGSLTQKEMSVTAVYTRKLGLEIKDLTGLVDKFDSFDKAAESAAMLSQAFGASVDAFKLMNEQDPAKRLDELRKSMAATGKSSENMTRQELHLLASTSGLSDEAAKLAFSTKNQGLSYDQVQKQSNKAEVAQLSQAKALTMLADNIERVVRTGTIVAGFWKNFVAGFERGFKMSVPYRTLLMTLRQGMLDFFWAGNKVGNMLANLPSVFETLGGITKIFSADRIGALLNGFSTQTEKGVTRIGGVVAGFRKIFEGNFTEGFAAIKDAFTRFFSTANLTPVTSGIKKFGLFIAKSFGEMLSDVAKNAPIYIDKLTAFIKDPKGFVENMRKAGSAGIGIFPALLIAFQEGFSKNGPVMDTLYKSIRNMLTTVWEKIKSDPAVQEIIKDVGLYMLGKWAVSNAGGIASASVSIAKQFGLIGDSAKNASGAVTSSGSSIAGSIGTLAAAAAAAYAAWELGKAIGEQAAKIADEEVKRYDTVAKKRAADFEDLQKKRAAGIAFTQDDFDKLGKLQREYGTEVEKESERIRNRKWYDPAEMANGFSLGVASILTLSNKFDEAAERGSLATKSLMGGQAEAMRLITEQTGVTVKQMLEQGNFDQAALAGTADIIDKTMPQIIAKFDKMADSAGLKGQERIDARTAFLKKNIIDQANATKDIALKIQAEAAAQANTEVNQLNLEGDKKLEAYRNIFARLQQEKNKQYAESHKFEPGAVPEAPKAVSAENIASLMQQKQSLEQNLAGLQKFASSGIIAQISKSIPESAKALEDFNTKLSTSQLASTINVTQGVVESVNKLNGILGDGKEGAFKLGEKLKRFADNSGLGKSGTYEIKNKGINLKLDLKVTMDAGEVERAILSRKESIIFDAIEESIESTVGNTEAGRARLRTLTRT